MKVLLSISLICVFATAIFAQQDGKISGRVTDAGTNPGRVEITITGESGKMIKKDTDKTGFFAFENLKDGSYTVSGQILCRTEKKDITVAGGQSVVVDLAFDSGNCAGQTQPEPINETVTIAADANQSIDEVSKTVDVIDGQQMRDRADITLVDSLRTIPGFRVQQLGGFGRVATIKTRGLRNQDTAILIDGMRFRDATGITGDATAFLSDITLTSVKKIEVLRGSGSSLYGTNAIGGTIDFQTPKPTSGWHGQLSGAGGGFGMRRLRGNANFGTTDNVFGFNLGLAKTSYSKGIDGDDKAKNTNIQARAEYNPFSKTNVSLRVFTSVASVDLNSNPDTFGLMPATNAGIIKAKQGVNFVFDADDPDNVQESKFLNGQIVVTQALTPDLTVQGSYSGLTTRRKNINGLLGVGYQSESTSLFEGATHTFNGHLEWVASKANRITVGYEFEKEKFGNRGFTPDGNGDFFTEATQASNTIYGQDLLELLNRKLQIAGGFRVQFFDVGLPNFSSSNAPYQGITFDAPASAITFDGSASYFFERSGTKIRAHAGNGYRVASLYERLGSYYSTFGTPAFFPLGDPTLKPEKSVAFDAGIEQNVTKRVRLTATYFYTTLSRTIGYDNNVTTFDRFGGYINTKGGIARGAEFGAEIKPDMDTDVFASYTFTNSDQRLAQVDGSGIIRTLGVPANLFTLSATRRFRRFWVNADFTAESSYLAPIFSNSIFRTYVYRFDGNRKLDLTAGYTFSIKADSYKLRVFGTIANVLDREYYDNGFRTEGANARLGVNFSF